MRLAVSLPSLLPRLFKLLQARSASRHPERNLYRHVIPTFADVPAGILRSGGSAEDERQKERDRQTERERERERERTDTTPWTEGETGVLLCLIPRRATAVLNTACQVGKPSS